MITIRQKILGYLNKTRTASTREIARALKMSTAAARYHLRVLALDGRVELVLGQGHESRGRPEKVYTLPYSVLGDNLALLSDALLTDAAINVNMDAVAKRLAGEIKFKNQPLVKQLNQTLEKLNQMNYHARWEAGSQGPRIIFGHCPYAAIIQKHPELCRMDEAMLEEWLGQPAKQILKIGQASSSLCVFVLRR